MKRDLEQERFVGLMMWLNDCDYRVVASALSYAWSHAWGLRYKRKLLDDCEALLSWAGYDR